MAELKFDVTRDDFTIIGDIVDRAVAMARKAGIDYNHLTARMDITACHANGTPLRLAELRDADNFNFAHDVFGIRRHINRETGALERGFFPRFASRE